MAQRNRRVNAGENRRLERGRRCDLVDEGHYGVGKVESEDVIWWTKDIMGGKVKM